MEQAIAKTQTKEEQVSLETAIASQLANDPVLGQPETAEAQPTDESDDLSEPVLAVDAETTALADDRPAADEIHETTEDKAGELEAATTLIDADKSSDVELTADAELTAEAELAAASPRTEPAEVDSSPLLNLEAPAIAETEPEKSLAAPDSDPWESDASQPTESAERPEVADLNAAAPSLESLSLIHI